MDGWVDRLVQRAERKETFRSESALHEACYASVSLGAVQRILHLHPEANMIKDENGRIPLHWALTSKNQHAKARLLLHYLITQRGEELPLEEIMLHRNNLGYTALDHACCSDAPPDIIESLLSICPRAAAHTNARRTGKTPLHMLLEYNKSNGTEVNTASALLLLNAYPEALAVGDRFGNLPLHYVCYRQESFEAFHLLLNASIKMGCVELKNELDGTPLHAACVNDVPAEMIQYLLEASPRTVREMNNKGDTPLHLAFAHGASIELKNQLIDFGGEELFGIVNDRGQVPLQQGTLDDTFHVLISMPHLVMKYHDAVCTGDVGTYHF